MSDTSPDPKPDFDENDPLDATEMAVIIAGVRRHDYANHLTISRLLATITTLRASLGEAEKRAEEAEAIKFMWRDDCLEADQKAAASEGLVAVLREALAFNVVEDRGSAKTTADAWLNIGGAIEDIEYTGRCDAVALATLKRVEWQLCKARTALSTTSATRTLGREHECIERLKEYCAGKLPLWADKVPFIELVKWELAAIDAKPIDLAEFDKQYRAAKFPAITRPAAAGDKI